MESEGPYTVLGMDDGFGVLDSRCKVVVAGEATVFENLENAEKCETLANSAYAAGRKAERERCLNVLKKYPDDGRELGDILEAIKLEIKGLI